MNKSLSISRNASFTSIRLAPSGNVSPDASKHENAQTPVIDFEALKAISRIVQTVEWNDEVGRNMSGHDGETCPRRDEGSSKSLSPGCGEDNNPDKAES
jgi:hypothetical protein